MPTLVAWELQAHNTATQSDNKIHDDEVARRFGFGGGLVPGVDVYAYLTHPPAEAWGLEWLERGTIQARFGRPVYEGDTVRVVPVEIGDDDAGQHAQLELRNSADEVCATAEASLPHRAVEGPSLDGWPEVAQVAERPPASSDALRVGTAFGVAPHTFRADRAGEYLDAVRETLLLYREANVAHPGWLLRDANYVLSGNVRLGPWIHVESSAQHYRLVGDGESVAARSVVTKEWEHKGHHFVTLDVAIIANRELAAGITHTAIYAPRQAR